MRLALHAMNDEHLGVKNCRKIMENEQFGIGEAVKLMRAFGKRVRRAGWNGKGMWLQLQVPDRQSKMTLPYVYMKTAQDDLVPWVCNQADLLATDWELAD
jgi:Protein of unknown function (DUF2829)